LKVYTISKLKYKAYLCESLEDWNAPRELSLPGVKAQQHRQSYHDLKCLPFDKASQSEKQEEPLLQKA
jgi:hypothetical protein